MRSHIEERAIVVAKYILEKNTTVRQTAKTFGVSKSTIHKDVTERLEEINPTLAKEVKMVLEKNKSDDIDVIIDRIIIKEDSRSRISEAVEIATKLSNGG